MHLLRVHGRLAIVAAVLSLALGLGVGQAEATAVTLSISPTSGPAGTSVDVHGMHWVASSEIDVLFVQNGRSRLLATTTTNQNGYFHATVSIPANAALGASSIRVQQPASGIRRSAIFTVT